MAQNTKIDWADDSFNFAEGCDPTTNPGCAECYAVFRLLPMRDIQPGMFRRTSEENWQKPIRWQKKLEQTGEVRLVFGNSMSDFFHRKMDDFRPDAWEVIRRTPNLIWILLTQRPGNIQSRLPADWGNGYQNVWLGVSASDQEHADKRIPTLLNVPAALHLVSLEPLVGPISLRDSWLKELGWVITGGMSGKNWNRYPLYPGWVRFLRDQCQQANIPFFFKQLGGPANDYRDGDKAILDGHLHKAIPASTTRPVHHPAQLSLLPLL